MIGVVAPLGFLRSRRGIGIGEYRDLLLLIDWCALVGFKIIQLLPINDTGLNPSPYSSISSTALHPIYLSIDQHTPFEKSLNSLYRAPYHTTLKHKLKELKKGIDTTFDEVFANEHPHLLEYALFKALQEDEKHSSFSNWKQALQNPSNFSFSSLVEDHKDSVAFFLQLQKKAIEELKKVKAYADSKGIFLMGDIPLLISEESHDVYFHPSLFDCTSSAGAPPDMYSDEGQSWGLPTYRWESHFVTNFSFWKRRLQFADNFYDYFRIDHILGFFRFWKVPKGRKGKYGHFSITDPSIYLSQGEKILHILKQACHMKPIAEDLGDVPPGLRDILMHLQIPGMRVLRWEEDDPSSFPKLSYTTLGTHDSSTLSEWYKSENKIPLIQEERIALLRQSLNTPSLFRINMLQEYLNLDPNYQFSSDCDERYNLPGINLPTNWSIRMIPFIEDLLENRPLNEKIQSLIASSFGFIGD